MGKSRDTSMMKPAMIELIALPPVHAVAVIPETEARSSSSIILIIYEMVTGEAIFIRTALIE